MVVFQEDNHGSQINVSYPRALLLQVLFWKQYNYYNQRQIPRIFEAIILAVSVSKRCTLDLSVVKAQGSIAGFLFSNHSTIPEKFSITTLSLHVLTVGCVRDQILLFLGIFSIPKSSRTGRHVLLGQQKKSSKHMCDLVFLHTNENTT